MLRWWIRAVVLILVLLAGGAVLYLFSGANREEPASPALTIASPVPPPDFSVVLVHESSGSPRVSRCNQQHCILEPLPGRIEGKGVFDGDGWLYYQEAESVVSKITKKILTRAAVPGGVVTQLIEETPLTSPRDLYISPTGKHVAFFLDNIDRPGDQLTELWLYDKQKAGIRLVAEKLYRPDIRSHVRWNRTGNTLWFLADTGEQDNPEDELTLVIVPLAGAVREVFSGVEWEKIQEVVDSGVMDISPSGGALAYAAPGFLGREELKIVTAGTSTQSISAKGTIPFIQFLEDESLLYAVQDGRGVTFWKLSDGVARYVARQTGQLLSAQGESAGEFVVMAVQSQPRTAASLVTLHILTGTVTTHATLGINDDRLLLTQLTVMPTQADLAPGDNQEVLEDAELAAFIDQNFARVVGNETDRPQRFLVTDQPNTIYIDYISRAGSAERLLVAIHDLAHVDWSIKGRYTSAQSEWHKVQGGSLPDPSPVRLYEWEEGVGQWILKARL